MRLLFAWLLLLAPARQAGVTVSGKVTVEEKAKKQLVILRYNGEDKRHLKPPPPSPAVVYLEGPPASAAEGKAVEILQQALQFRPRVVAVQLGTVVNFPNSDPVFHNVFSLSPGNKFDHGKYRTGESKGEAVKAVGRIDARCKVHEHMVAYIHVVGSPHFAVAREDGAFSIPNVPPGKYTLVAWKEEYGIEQTYRKPIEVTQDGLNVDLKLAVADGSRSGGGAGR